MAQKRKTIISTLIIIIVAALTALDAWWWHMTADTYRARSVAMVEQVRTTTLTVNGRRVPLITNLATRRADTIYHMGTGWQPRAMITGGLAVADAVIALKGENATSDVVTELAFGAYNKLFAPNRTKVDWLSADESNVDDYIADPLCGADATVGLFRQMLHGIRFNQRQSNLRRMDADTPVLFVAGDKDPVGSCGKGVIQSYEAFKAAGVRDCTLKLYPGLRHEILNEKPQRDQITNDIETWLLSKLP